MPSKAESRTDTRERTNGVRSGRVLLAGTLALGAVILVVAFGSTKPNVIYARTVSEFTKQPRRETTVRLTGFLVRGSLCKVPARCEYRFRLSDKPHASGGTRNEIEVRYAQCAIPDTLRDVPGLEFEVAVEGELCSDCRHFDAQQVVSKCPAKYELRYDGGMNEALNRPVRSCASKSRESNAGK